MVPNNRKQEYRQNACNRVLQRRPQVFLRPMRTSWVSWHPNTFYPMHSEVSQFVHTVHIVERCALNAVKSSIGNMAHRNMYVLAFLPSKDSLQVLGVARDMGLKDFVNTNEFTSQIFNKPLGLIISSAVSL